MARRTSIPKALDRAVRVEAGHRCAIPTCRQAVGLEVHHIVPWARVKKHEFENLILLCSNCHSRVTNGEIDTKSVKAYKANLSLTNARYGDLERRILEYFAQHPGEDSISIDVSHELLLKYLLDDGLLIKGGFTDGSLFFGVDGETPESSNHPFLFAGPWSWRLTETGREFVERLRTADPIA